MTSSPGDVTRLLAEISRGNRDAESRLVDLVYGELHKLAKRFMFGERPDHTLQPTVLVHDAFVKLVGYNSESWTDREHFFAVAAGVMRRILIDHARGVSAKKRGGGRCKISLEDVFAVTPERSEDLIALDEALTSLHQLDPRQAKVVELRFFAGLTEEEIATAMGLSSRTVKRDWTTARAWLHDRLSGNTA